MTQGATTGKVKVTNPKDIRDKTVQGTLDDLLQEARRIRVLLGMIYLNLDENHESVDPDYLDSEIEENEELNSG